MPTSRLLSGVATVLLLAACGSVPRAPTPAEPVSAGPPEPVVLDDAGTGGPPADPVETAPEDVAAP